MNQMRTKIINMLINILIKKIQRRQIFAKILPIIKLKFKKSIDLF